MLRAAAAGFAAVARCGLPGSRHAASYSLLCGQLPVGVQQVQQVQHSLWRLGDASGQWRTKITVPEKKLSKKVSRSSGPGGQSVNMSDTRVQLSFQVDTADWLPEPVKEKMRVLHKNRISSKGEFTVACQISSSQIENSRLALLKVQELVDQAEQEVENDKWEGQKMDPKEWMLEKMKRDGREEELEKRAEAIKEQKRRSRERTKSKKIDFS